MACLTCNPPKNNRLLPMNLGSRDLLLIKRRSGLRHIADPYFAEAPSHATLLLEFVLYCQQPIFTQMFLDALMFLSDLSVSILYLKGPVLNFNCGF